jgi:two-component system sensor histidine kinase/response regulator
LQKNIRNYTRDKIENQVAIIYEAARNTYNLLNNLLEWSGSQSGGIVFNPALRLISDVTNTELILLKQQAERKDVKLELITKGHEIEIEADSNLLSSVIRNFISNAIKYSYQGDKVEITLEFEKDFFSFLVKDYGVGMDTETRNKLFKLNINESLHGTSGERGTGLGLLLCKDFIEKHNGKIWFESEPGKGSVFGFKIPVKVQR